ncbi:hypothetical protein CPB83DRAFT_853847 [Crepidotus variabilis]|uniref:C2H2-type domain-containing protein n=1 Tax=Crepidotus variabilis TaxID=179855 RepID=A0A9P6EH24_9AGAR|nr:hypothetical protein CPB83DRAFT_853847 [Crepidotus variabilis]
MPPPPPSQSVSTTLQPARWDSKSSVSKGKARDDSSSDSGSEDEDDVLRPSFGMSSSNHRRHEDSSRSDSRASSSKSATSREFEGDVGSLSQKRINDSKQESRDHRTEEKPLEFRMIKQASLTGPRANSTASSGSGESEEVTRGGAEAGRTGTEKQKDLQPIPSPPWAKSKPLPVERDHHHTMEQWHDHAKNQNPTVASSSSRGSNHHYNNASSSTSFPPPPTSLYASQYNVSHLDSRQSSRGEEAGPSSEARYAWAAPQLARPLSDTNVKPTLFKWVHSNPPPPPLQQPQSHSVDQVPHRDDGVNIPHRRREADEQSGSEVGVSQDGRRSDYHHSERDTQWAKQVTGSESARPPAHPVSRPMSGSDPVPRSRSASIGRGYPPSPRSYGARPPSPYANIPGQHYGAYGMRYQHPPPPPMMPSPKSNGYPYYRSQSYTYPLPHSSYPARPPTPTRHRSYDHSSIGGPSPLSPRAGQKRRFEGGEEDRGPGRKRSGTRDEDVGMDHRGRELPRDPSTSSFANQDIEMGDQTTRLNNSASHRTGHPRPGPGRLHWMPPEVAPSGSTPPLNSETSSEHSRHSLTAPASQRSTLQWNSPLTGSTSSTPYHPPYAPPPPPGYRAAYPPPPPHGYLHGPPTHHDTSSRDIRSYPYPPPPTSHYGHPGYPPPPPHPYGPGVPPPPSGPGIPPVHHYHYANERERIYEAEWHGRPSPHYEGHRASSYSSRPRSTSMVGSDRPPPPSYYSYPNSRSRGYPPGGPPLPPPQPYPSHPPHFHQHPHYNSSHSPPPPPIPPPPPPHFYPPHLDPPTNTLPPPIPPPPNSTYKHEPYPHPHQDARRRYQAIMKQRVEGGRDDAEPKASPGSPMDTQQDSLPTSPQVNTPGEYLRAAVPSNGYVPPSEAESAGMATTPAPLSVNAGGIRSLLHSPNSPFESGDRQNGTPSAGGEYEQHPLRQQTSYLPMNAVGGAQFVLKPPRQPKPRSLKPRTNGSGSGDSGKPDKPKEPVLKFKEMTGKEREGKRPRRRMKNRMANEHMLMSGGNIFVPHVMEMGSGMNPSEPITYVRMNSLPHPPAVAAHMAATIPAWDSNQPFVDLREVSRRQQDDDESTTSPSEASEASPPPPERSPPPTVMLSPRWTNEAGNTVGQEPVLHRSPSPMQSSHQNPPQSPKPSPPQSPRQSSKQSPPHSPNQNRTPSPQPAPHQTSRNLRQSPSRSPRQVPDGSTSQDLTRETNRSPPLATQLRHLGDSRYKFPPGAQLKDFLMSSPSPPPSPTSWHPYLRRHEPLSDDDLLLDISDIDPRKEFGILGPASDAEPEAQDSGDPVGSETNTFAAPARPSTTAKKYPCDVCDHIFTRSGDVKRHKISRHGEGSAGCICPFCDRVLTRQDALQRHWDWYCRKASRRNIHGYRLRMGLTDDEYEDAIDSSPVFLGPAPNALSRGEAEEDEAALGGSSGIDFKPYRTITAANGSRPSNYGRRVRRSKKTKKRAKSRPKDGVVQVAGGEDSDEDELESEDPLDGFSDNAKEEREARRMALGVDEDEEEIDQLDDSGDESRREPGVKSDAEGESIHGDDDSASESEASEQEGGSFGYRHTDKMNVEPARAPIRVINQSSALTTTRPASSQPASPIKDRSPSIPRPHEQQGGPNQPLTVDPAPSSTDAQLVNGTNYRSSPAPPQPTDPYTIPFRPLSTEPSSQPLTGIKSRSDSVSTTSSTQPTYTSSITFQHVTTFTRKPRPKRQNFDVDLDPSQTAAQGGQIRMRVLPQTTDMVPMQPALAIMHEHPHYDKKKGKRNDGQVPEYGFVPREYVYREKE